MTRKQIPALLLVLLGVVLTIHFGRNLIQVDTNAKKADKTATEAPLTEQGANAASAIKADLKDIQYSGDLVLKLNKSEISFSREPQIFGDEIFVPATELGNALGLYVHEVSDRYLIMYKNNIFVKMDLESNDTSINGKHYEISSGPYYSDQRIFVPLLYLLDAFRYNVDWDKSSGQISLSDDSSAPQFDFIDSDNYYKRIDMGDLGLRVSVPFHWDLLDEKSKTYGFKDDFEYFTLSVSEEKIKEDDTLADLEERVEKALQAKDKENLQINKINKMTNTPLASYAIYSDVAAKPHNLKQVTYVFKDGKRGLVLNFRFGDFTDESTALGMVETIAASLQLNKQSIQQRDEYYAEFPAFYDYGIHIETPLFANMTANDSLDFKGSVADSITGFNLRVSKDSQSMSFFIPVKNHKFDQKIYLPFGLGRHQIYLEAAEEGGLFKSSASDKLFEPLVNTDELNLLELSVINTSTSEIRYLIPSSRVPSNDSQFSDLAKLLSYKDDNSYKKAKSVYQWIEKNIELDAELKKNKLRSPKQVFDDSMANEEELAYFYATLMRSIGIPCRIVTGDYAGESHFWNELQINGKWIVADLGEEFAAGDGITAFFNLTRDDHYSDYKNIKVLAY